MKKRPKLLYCYVKRLINSFFFVFFQLYQFNNNKAKN